MFLSEYIIKIAIDKYNLERGKSFNYADFSIKPIEPNIRTDMGCEIFSNLETDFLRIRLYLIIAGFTRLTEYKVEVDGTEGLNNLLDEVHVSTGYIDFNYVIANGIIIDCKEANIPRSYLLSEEYDFLLDHNDKKIYLNEYLEDVVVQNPVIELSSCLVEPYTYGYANSISGDGNRIAVSSASYKNTDDGYKHTSGYVCTYTRVDERWVRDATIINENKTRDYFGSSVSLDHTGNTLVVGGSMVSVYNKINNAWVLVASLPKMNSYDANKEGYHVKISGDGNTIVINGDYSYTSIYKKINNAWVFLQVLNSPTELNSNQIGNNAFSAPAITYDGLTIGIVYDYRADWSCAAVYKLINGKYILEKNFKDFFLWSPPISGFPASGTSLWVNNISINDSGTIIALSIRSNCDYYYSDAFRYGGGSTDNTVMIFEKSNNEWTGKLIVRGDYEYITGDKEMYARSITVADNLLLVSADYHISSDINNLKIKPVVFAIKNINGVWTDTGDILNLPYENYGKLLSNNLPALSYGNGKCVYSSAVETLINDGYSGDPYAVTGGKVFVTNIT